MKRLNKKPIFTTGVASNILGIPVKTLINYENFNLTKVSRTNTGRRIYSEVDLFNILVIKHLIDNVNLTFAGVRFIIQLRGKLIEEENVDIFTYILSKRQIDQFVESIQ